MKQLLQSPATGSTTVADVPAPLLSAGMVLVRTVASVVSAGTERTSVEFAKKSLLAKARSRPDLVKKVLDKALTDGALTAWDAARNRLEQPQALGYSSAGVVIAVGEGAEGFRVGGPPLRGRSPLEGTARARCRSVRASEAVTRRHPFPALLKGEGSPGLRVLFLANVIKSRIALWPSGAEGCVPEPEAGGHLNRSFRATS